MSSGRQVLEKLNKEPPCQSACPARIDIPRYVRLIAQGDFEQALAVIQEKIPFPSVCGYICPHPCEAKCQMNSIGSPIAIRALKRFVADKGKRRKEKPLAKQTGKKVAIIGAGPTGLTASYYLARLGHGVTVFETHSQPGGMMRWGIPRFRLPEDILNAEINNIKDVGVEIRINTKVKSIDEISSRGFDAILIAVEAQRGLKIGVKGEDVPQVMDGVSFLREVNAGKKVKLTGKVCVVGGGNTAIDVARSALGLGADQVVLIYRRSRKEMLANAEEVDEAAEEGVEMLFQVFPSKITFKNGTLHMECVRTELGSLDESDRRRPIVVRGSEHSLYCNFIIAATGQKPEISEKFGLALGNDNLLAVDKETMATSKKGIFAGGDVVTGPTSVIEAIAAGRRATISIDKYLNGKGDITEKLVTPEGEVTHFMPDLTVTRLKIPKLPSKERISSFTVVEQPLTEEAAIEEAKRCLRCDLPIIADTDKCVGCITCELICSFKDGNTFNPLKAAIKVDKISGGTEYGITFTDECDCCGLCVRYCTHEALTRERKEGKVE